MDVAPPVFRSPGMHTPAVADREVLVAFGSNVGNGKALFHQALARLGENGLRCVAASDLYLTRPIGGPPDQPFFTNAVMRVATSLAAAEVVAALQRIETDLGRLRRERWGRRSVDLDLLLAADTIVDTPQCILPHPRMTHRRFVLEPACEIAADWVHPLVGLSLSALLDRLDRPTRLAVLLAERSDVESISCPPHRPLASAVESAMAVMRLDALSTQEIVPHSSWTIAWTDCPAQIASWADWIKLLVFEGRWSHWLNSPGALQRIYQGPILELGCRWRDEEAAFEFCAAIDAMAELRNNQDTPGLPS